MDNFDSFFDEYRKQVRSVSAKTMKHTIKEVKEDLLDSGICWMVTDNMIRLLALNDIPDVRIEGISTDDLREKLRGALNKDKFVLLVQDEDLDDHWMTLIGDYPDCHFVEHSPVMNNYSETMTIDEAVEIMVSIKEGTIPDRFYNKQAKHQYNFMSFSRRHMNNSVVLDYIK